MKEFGPKLFDALIQVLEEDQGMLPGTLEAKIMEKLKTISDYDWMKSEMEEIVQMAIELTGMNEKEFEDAIRHGRFKDALKDLFDKIQVLKNKMEAAFADV